MLVGILLCIVCVPLIQAQEEEIIVPDRNKTECINDMIEWCNKMKYPQQSAGMSMLSVTYQNPEGSYRVFCSSDSEGTNCTKNQDPWFACTADHILIYKERPILSLADEGDIDDEICSTADKAFNELFVQNLSYDNTTLKKEVQKGFEDFFEQIAIIQQQIEVINRRLNRIPYFWSGMYDSIVLKNPEETLVILDEDNSSGEGASEQEQSSTESPSNESTPNESTPNESTPNESPSNESASNESASNESASNESASNESASNESTSNESASNESASNESTSNESASNESTSNESASNESTSDESASKESTSDESASKESTSNESVSDELASSESAPSESISNESASGESIPKENNAEDTEQGSHIEVS